MKNFLQTTIFLIISLIIFSAALNTVQAQKLVFVYVHGLGTAPLDKSSRERYSSGFGGEAGIGLGMNKTFFTGSIGYTSFGAKQSAKDETYIPVKIGIRQYLPLKIIFIDANVGVGFINNSEPTSETPNPSNTRPAADLGAGVKLGNLELGANFDTFKEPNPDGWAGWFVFKAGFRFGL